MSLSTLKVAVIQLAVALGEPDENLRKVEKLVREAALNKPDVIVLPETWNTGYFPINISEQAVVWGKRAVEKMSDLARELEIYLVGGSISEVNNGQLVNSAKVFNRNGLEIASYQKIHLFSPGEENRFYTEGNKVVTFEIEGHICGVIICYDLRFPELVRRLALDGAEILFVPAEWPHPRLEHWRILQKARAIENQIFVISCNGVGLGNGVKFCGHSSVISPWGEIMQEAEEAEEIFQIELNTDAINEVREKIPVFIDRRYSYYQLS
ncbi:carbon-nitrogen family hydrolase [Desulfosporosinus sp. OT]|uniref:carbon-nitrogen family hydrolase n=1 Tax=Desulfosporosinus sp. OT TaxID=913865 RepID=UPI000223A894|nr:carbon-nitrogen family hydrolase [Desulfosporosinus sp. OT]EGW40537.1 carbon-nitrogen hydrolase family protein [Desulfosporosinus sp. OT]